MPLATRVMKVQNVLVSTTSWGEISVLHHVHWLTGLSAWETVFQEGASSWVLCNDLHLLSRAVTLTHCASTLSTLFNIISLKSHPINNTLAEWNAAHGESNLSTVLMTLSLSANRSRTKSKWIKARSRINTHTTRIPRSRWYQAGGSYSQLNSHVHSLLSLPQHLGRAR